MSATAPAPRRRLGVEERRAAILGPAREAFSAAPYAAVAVPDIARAAGASTALVFHYFGSKAGLYEAVLAGALAERAGARRGADAALPPNSSARDRVRTWVLAELDHVRDRGEAWASGWVDGEEPEGATAVREAARAETAAWLDAVLGVADGARHRFAVVGFLGFLDRSRHAWVAAGCPEDDRHPLVEAALGALEGALGDWGR